MATKNAPKNSKPKKLNSPITDDQPDWPTQVKKVYSSGVIVTVNNEVWLYRRVPLGPVVSARSMKDAVDIGSPIFRACQEVEALTSRSMAKNRRMSKHNYRDIHMLLVNVPKLYVPDDKQPLKAYLAQQFSGKTVDQRLLLFGVRLRNSAFRSGWDYALQALTEAITLQNVGVQLPEYAADFKKVSAALTRAGMIEATSEQLHLADSWWNLGRNADVPYLVHSDHLHMFTAPGSLTDAARLERDKVPCSAPEWKKLRQTHTLSMSAFDTFNFNWRDINSSEVHFFPELLGAGAQAVILRGKVEPTDITRNELRSGRRRMMADINESRSQGAMDRAEQDEKLETLRQMEDLYSGSTLSLPSIIDCSIVTALNGSRGGSYDVRGETARVKLGLLTERQEKALAEMMLGSNVRSNPNLRDLPATAAAFTGAPNLAMCGDRTGALLGFTENDKQPVYISSDAAANEDQLPMFLVAAGTGSGKTMSLLNMADQWARAGVPQIITDWKPGSDHSDTVRAAGGQCLKLSDLTSGDGVFDPLRFSHDVKAGLEYASSMLLEVSPWPEGSKKYESQLMVALDYGVKNGATCIGQALKIALDAKKASEDMVKPILDYAETSINFRACVGMDPQAEGLAVADGITYIFVGDSSLELPPMGKPATTMNQRIAAQLVRMAVFGSVMALAYRDGVCHFDEAWVLTNNSPEELDRIGRLVRQLRVLPILYTQRVSDAVNAGLTGFISRGLIMHIADREEALAACALFKLEPTEERLERITARSSLGKGTDAGEDSAGLNWNSLKALVMKSDDEGGPRIVKRGAVGIHIDLEGRAVPVVIDLPPDFLEMASTNPVDIARREAKKRLRLLSKDSAPIEETEPVIITAADEDADMFAAS